MAAIHDLLNQIEDEDLRARLEQEISKLSKTKKFGLVFEEHLPECTPLYDILVRRGSTVAKKTGAVSDMYEVNSIKDGVATCYHKVTEEKEEIPVDELVCVAQFGEPIYPYLKPIDSICNAPNSDLWHTLIEADNYHALQLLEYLYAGKVDCIYIDPPYNTGARDWKYNNDYVDGADNYRHSKWLSFMERRLRIAKKLLNRDDSVLIVTIDEKEYLHLGCLLEGLFPEARIQMISTVINPSGAARMNSFGRTDEYIFFVMLGSASPGSLPLSMDWKATSKNNASSSVQPLWRALRRMGSHDLRTERPNLFFPIIFNKKTGEVLRCGDSPTINERMDDYIIDLSDDEELVWPLKPDGTESCWQLSQDEIMRRKQDGFIRVKSKNNNGWYPTYLAKGEISKIQAGIYKVIGRGGPNNELILESIEENPYFVPGTQWRIPSHDASTFGSVMVSKILCDKTRFSFPKSLYAVHDTIRFFVSEKPNALIIDFFAGSGTTLHAVNLLNARDKGNRRCIVVTNNEVSDAESKTLRLKGINPGEDEWESLGIAKYVTWPRTVCSIIGKDINGKPLSGEYLETDFKMKDGFKSNVAYFKLSFLDKTAVALGLQFAEMLPALWMKAGAHGPCPQLEDDKARMMILTENRFAILMDEKYFAEFDVEVQKHPEIQTIYIVTDSEAGYHEMISGYAGKDTFQLYRDYLDNFRINTGR